MLRLFLIPFFAAMLLWAAPAQAGVVGETLGELGMSDEVQTLGDTLHAEATALAGTLGRGKVDTVRGASGALGELAINSGELICNGWIIGFRVKIRNMVIENARLEGAARDSHLGLIRKMQEFADRLEIECARVGLLGPQGPSGAVNEDGAIIEPEPEPKDTRVRPREGETIADEICRRKCVNEYVKMETEERALAAAEKNLEWAKQQVRERRADYEDKRRRLEQAQKDFRAADRIVSAGLSGRDSAEKRAAYEKAGRTRSDAQREVERLTPEVDRARKAMEDAQAFARSVEGHLQNNVRRTEAARRAYYQCLKSCIEAAQRAGEATTLTCPDKYKCPAPSQGERKSEPAAPVKRKTAASCPAPVQKALTVGPNNKYGTAAQRQEKMKSTAKNVAIGALGGLGGKKGVTLGGGGMNDPFVGGGKKSSGGPKTKKDPLKGDFARLADNAGTDLGLRAGMVNDSLVLSSRVFDSEAGGTFHTLWLTDAAGNVHLPREYMIYTLYQDWKLTVWWTQDRWVNGEHVYHDEGREITTGRNELGKFAAWYEGEKGVENSIWANMGFQTATKGIQSLGAAFDPGNIATEGPCPVTATIFVTEPQKDPVTAQPFTFELTPDGKGWTVTPYGAE